MDGHQYIDGFPMSNGPPRTVWQGQLIKIIFEDPPPYSLEIVIHLNVNLWSLLLSI
jgi:hypothetical protein